MWFADRPVNNPKQKNLVGSRLTNRWSGEWIFLTSFESCQPPLNSVVRPQGSEHRVFVRFQHNSVKE